MKNYLSILALTSIIFFSCGKQITPKNDFPPRPQGDSVKPKTETKTDTARQNPEKNK